jgi:hypothetical protein
MDDLDHQRAVWAFGSITARKPKVVFLTFFLGSVKTGVEPNILVRDLYAPTVSSFREIIHFLPTKKTENDNAIVV